MSIRFAILGTANIARKVGPGIQNSDHAELSGIASRSRPAAKEFAQALNIPLVFDSYEQAISSPEIDAVYIPLPPALHAEWTIRAAEAGKHVLCEKPLARNSDEVARMIAACQKNNVVLLDGVMWYHTERAARIRNLISNGHLGSLRQISSAFTFHWDSMPMENIRMHRGMGGGSLLDLGWYCVGAILSLFNEMPERVFATAQWHNHVDTRMNAILWFSQGRMASFECGFDTVRRRWIEVAGTERTLYCPDFTRPWSTETAAFTTLDGEGRQAVHSFRYVPQETCMVDAFCQLIRSHNIRHSWLELSRKTQQVCDVLDHSARTEQVVSVGESECGM
ncbi:MAG: Gfo/Idh/MocA family oxidoreductase [Planctomycetaceae bacterium]|nr:Gfo/Idh/MocA family oxidoreductase [Planctomycetaceae bacterium]